MVTECVECVDGYGVCGWLGNGSLLLIVYKVWLQNEQHANIELDLRSDKAAGLR